MARIGSMVAAQVVRLLTGPNGANLRLTSLRTAAEASAMDPGALEVRAQNAPADLVERGEIARYPMVLVYCEKVNNNLVEKFRTFSGMVSMAAEVRHSKDRLQGLQDGLELCADAVTQVLDSNRGDWGSGIYYAGGYQVTYGPVKHGGQNYLQTAKVTFEIGVSLS